MAEEGAGARISGGKERCGEEHSPPPSYPLQHLPHTIGLALQLRALRHTFFCMIGKLHLFSFGPGHPSEDIAMQTSLLHLDSSENSRSVPSLDVHTSTLPTARLVKRLLRLVECFESALFVSSVQGPHQLDGEPTA